LTGGDFKLTHYPLAVSFAAGECWRLFLCASQSYDLQSDRTSADILGAGPMNRQFAFVLVATLSAWIGAASAEQDKSSQAEPKGTNKKSWNDAAIKLTDDNFEKEAITSKTPIVIEFWAAWSPPSRRLSPTLQAVFNKYDGKLRFGRVDVDKCPAVCQKFNVEGKARRLLFRPGLQRTCERISGRRTDWTSAA
jgi:thiol-disulfide isomerase/thioredoxin